MPGQVVDKYANIYHETVTSSAANTLTFLEVNIGLTIFDKVGILIHKLQVDPDNNYRSEMVAATDLARFAITQDNSLTAIGMEQRAVIDSLEKAVIAAGTPGNALVSEQPFEKDYSTLPGGGLLVAPKPLYFAIQTTGYTAALSAVYRMYFTIVKLKPEEYFELLESRRFFG